MREGQDDAAPRDGREDDEPKRDQKSAPWDRASWRRRRGGGRRRNGRGERCGERPRYRGHLHRHGHVHWTDNRLTVEWSTVADGVAALRDEVLDLYRAGIDRSKLTHWMAGHDLVAASVTPAAGSRWAAASRAFEQTEDPRGYIDLVLEDEFPLSIFYSSLKAKLTSA